MNKWASSFLICKIFNPFFFQTLPFPTVLLLQAKLKRLQIHMHTISTQSYIYSLARPLPPSAGMIWALASFQTLLREKGVV